MNKKIAISALGITGVIGAAAAGYMLNDRAKKQAKKMDPTLENAGVPDQVEEMDLAQLENAKMVSEGSQYGIHYYNEKTEDNMITDQQ